MVESTLHPEFYVELLLNVVGLALGVVLVFRARDNRLMLTWGIYTVLLMLFILSSNIGLAVNFPQRGLKCENCLLSIDMLLGTFAVGTIAAIFPILSLRPAWLNVRRKILLSTPLLLSMVIVRCFYWFDGSPTPLHSTQSIFDNLHRPDVQMRVAIFLLSIVTTFYYLAIPFIHRWIIGVRKISQGMYFYILATLLMEILYFFYASTSNVMVADIYGYALVLAPIVISIIFMFNENPLSKPLSDSHHHSDTDSLISAGQVMSPELLRVYEQIDQYMEKEAPYTVSNYSITQLVSTLEIGHNMVIRAIRERGFSGFSEYVSFWRIEHFKILARKFPGLSIKDLMFGSGFTSRSSFYRQFAQKENMSPKEYIEKKL